MHLTLATLLSALLCTLLAAALLALGALLWSLRPRPEQRSDQPQWWSISPAPTSLLADASSASSPHRPADDPPTVAAFRAACGASTLLLRAEGEVWLLGVDPAASARVPIAAASFGLRAHHHPAPEYGSPAPATSSASLTATHSPAPGAPLPLSPPPAFNAGITAEGDHLLLHPIPTASFALGVADPHERELLTARAEESGFFQVLPADTPDLATRWRDAWDGQRMRLIIADADTLDSLQDTLPLDGVALINSPPRYSRHRHSPPRSPHPHPVPDPSSSR